MNLIPLRLRHGREIPGTHTGGERAGKSFLASKCTVIQVECSVDEGDEPCRWREKEE
jgi:hypothetical protein